MPNVPGATHLGQGIPGGRSSLPGEITSNGPGDAGLIPVAPGVPKLSSSFDAPSIPTPSLTLPARNTSAILSAQQNNLPSKKAYGLSTAMALIDRVHQGTTRWQDAQTVLKDLPDDERSALQAMIMHRYGKSVPDTATGLQKMGVQPLDELRAISKPAPTGGGLISHLAGDTTDLVKGFIPGLALAGKALGKDAVDIVKNPLSGKSLSKVFAGGEFYDSEFSKKVLAPMAHQEAQQWGPFAGAYADLAIGNMKGYRENSAKFNTQFNQHPLGPILDLLAVASAGVGTVGRVAGATEALRVTKLGKDANGLTTVGADAGINLKVLQTKSGLWQVRDRGKIVASKFPDHDSAVAHAQSLTTGGVAPKALSDSFEMIYHGGPKGILPSTRFGKEDDVFGKGLYGTSSRAVAGAHYAGEHLNEGQVYSMGIPKEKLLGDQLPPAAMPEVVKAVQKFATNPDAAIVRLHQPNFRAQELFGENPDLDKAMQAIMSKHGFVGLKYRPFTDGEDIAAMGDESAQSLAASQEVGQSHEYLIWDDKAVKKGIAALPKPISRGKLALSAATSRGAQGSLIDAYEKARGITHEQEHAQIAEIVADVLANPNLRLDRRTIRETISDVGSDLKATVASDRSKTGDIAGNLPSFISPEGFRGTAHAAQALGITLREASDLVRAGAIYLRPAYLPNNWAGNLFMNTVQQGVFAPANLAKSLVLDKHIGMQYTRAIDASLGSNAAEVVTSGTGRGYIASLTQPAAHVMGAIADQPFRRASWLHEARKMGYNNLTKVKELFDRATGTGAESEAALRDIAVIARKAQEEIVKFGNMNDIERGILRNLVFVYSWMRGAGRYAGRFPFQHAIQTAGFNQASHQGNQWLDKTMGGVPSFLVGAIPVGHDKNGNPILINPFSLNPLGTGLQIAQAAQGTYNVIRHPSQFNKYASSDITSLFNPIAQAYIGAREGGQPVIPQVEGSIAAVKLAQDLKHPGEGSIYPTSRKEAIGHFLGGSLYPREANQAAITKSLEREGSNNPLALIQTQVDQYQKLTGHQIPPEFVAAYQSDLVATQQQSSFQQDYASRHGQAGFKNLPPQNRAEAAVEYLRRHKIIPDSELNRISDNLRTIKTDGAFNDLANTLWSSTGTGSIKRAWDQMMSDAKNQQLSRKRP